MTTDITETEGKGLCSFPDYSFIAPYMYLVISYKILYTALLLAARTGTKIARK